MGMSKRRFEEWQEKQEIKRAAEERQSKKVEESVK